MILLIPISKDKEYTPLTENVSPRSINKLVRNFNKAELEAKKGNVPEKGEIKGELKPFSKISEKDGKQYFTLNYIAKLMKTDPTQVSRCKKALMESGEFLSTNILDFERSNTKYYRISDEKIADNIISAINEYFFFVETEDEEAIKSTVKQERFLGALTENQESEEKYRFTQDKDRIIYYRLVQDLFSKLQKSDSLSENQEELYKKLEQAAEDNYIL